MLRHFAIVTAVCLAVILAGQEGRAQTPPAAPQSVPAGKVLIELTFAGDYQRMEEFAKRFSAQVIRSAPPELILLIDRTRLPELRQAGYTPRFPEPDEVFEQIVHVEPSSDAMVATVRNLGGRLVQREPAYAVFRVNRRQLRLLQQQGLKVRPIREAELLPRWVEISPADEQSVAAVVAAGVDVIEGRGDRILARAFDEQIESLTRAGLKVTVIQPPKPPR